MIVVYSYQNVEQFDNKVVSVFVTVILVFKQENAKILTSVLAMFTI